jgi:hypothetical protein
MRGGPAKREPGLGQDGKDQGMYKTLRAARCGHEKFVLHDGPPYANGQIHMGHAVNKILKDMIVKARQLKGLDAAYIPGWDCHGLPIENAIEKKYGRNLPRDEMQAKSRAFATEQIASRWPTSSAWACWATGTIPIAPWTSSTRPTRSARSSACRARLRLPRPEAGVLVLRLRLVAGRIRDRVRRQEVADAGRGFKATSRQGSRPPSACGRAAKPSSSSSGPPPPGPSRPTRR